MRLMVASKTLTAASEISVRRVRLVTWTLSNNSWSQRLMAFLAREIHSLVADGGTFC
jgi:hypothetical protein